MPRDNKTLELEILRLKLKLLKSNAKEKDLTEEEVQERRRKKREIYKRNQKPAQKETMKEIERLRKKLGR